MESRVLQMLSVELETAHHYLTLSAAQSTGAVVAEDQRRIAAALVLIEEIQKQARYQEHKPRQMLPFLQCAIHLLACVTTQEMRRAREHVSAACDLLATD